MVQFVQVEKQRTEESKCRKKSNKEIMVPKYTKGFGFGNFISNWNKALKKAGEQKYTVEKIYVVKYGKKIHHK